MAPVSQAANGICYFLDTWQPSFREDGIFANQAMVTAVTALNAQIASLAPELNSGTIPGLVTVAILLFATPERTALPIAPKTDAGEWRQPWPSGRRSP